MAPLSALAAFKTCAFAPASAFFGGSVLVVPVASVTSVVLVGLLVIPT